MVYICIYIYYYTHIYQTIQSIMLDSKFTVETADDMTQVENRLVELTQGEYGRCNILNTTEYIKFRLAAIYGTNNGVQQITRDRIKMILDNNIVYIYYGIGNEHIFIEEDENSNKRFKSSLCDGSILQTHR